MISNCITRIFSKARCSSGYAAMVLVEPPATEAHHLPRCPLDWGHYETTAWIASARPRQLSAWNSAGGSFRTTIACRSRDPRAVPGGPDRQRQRGDGAIGVDGNSPASDEAQSNYRGGMEGFLRCGNTGSLAGAGFARADTAPRPTSAVIGLAFVTPASPSEGRCRLHQYLGSDSDGSSVSVEPGRFSVGKDAGVWF